MASYKILADNSTLGAQGSTVTEEQILAVPYDVELLIASKIIEPTTKTTKPDTKE